MLKKLRSIGLFFALAGAIVLMGCSGAGNDPAATDGDSEVYTIGDSETHTVGGESFTMIYAQDQASISFPTKTDDGTPATLTMQFWMAETEVTNAVAASVFQWAYDNGRFSAMVSDPNGLDTSTARHGKKELLDLDDLNCRVDYNGSGSFTAESGYENNPVTNITWYGAVMFCNWLTEMRDGNDGNVVYEWVDTGDGIWQDDETDENIDLNGYRLPSSDEWEYAARYLGTTEPSTGGNLDTERKYGNDDASWTDGYYWTPGNYASGATADYNDASACQAVAVYSGQVPSPTDEATVKSLGSGSANELGLYDMSGNVGEWCFTENGSDRVNPGGNLGSSASSLQLGYWHDNNPDYGNGYLGFRLCRTAN